MLELVAFSQPRSLLTTTLLALLVGAEERVAFPFFKHAVSLADYASPASNPGLLLCQFCASLLNSEHPAYQLLCRSQGFSTFTDLHRYSRAAMDECRSALVQASGDAFLRHWQRFSLYPWRLAALVAEHVPEAEKERIARDFCTACPQCLDAAFSRPLRCLTGTCASSWRTSGILSNFWLQVLRDWVAGCDISTYLVELQHANNKHAAHPLSKFEQMAAKSVNSGAKRVLKQACEAVQQGEVAEEQVSAMPSPSQHGKLLATLGIPKHVLATHGTVSPISPQAPES